MVGKKNPCCKTKLTAAFFRENTVKNLFKKKPKVLLLLGSFFFLIFTGCDYVLNSDAASSTTTSSASSSAITSGLDDIVSTKYTTATTNATTQSKWGALNCHDPKLFQDDDGTYYVYSTDASIGNAHKVGLQVRASSDLVNWTCESSSALQGNWDSDMLSVTGEVASSSASTLGSNASYTATTWAPTVIKQNSEYYMFHGIITDNVDGFDDTTEKGPTAWIGLAISDSPEGPFIPAHEYDSDTYSNSTLVRYAWNQPTQGFSAYIGGEMTQMTVNSITVTDDSRTSESQSITNSSLAATGNWYDVSTTAYEGVTGLTGDFTVTYDITLDDVGDSNWEKWAFALVDEDTMAGWYLRADKYTNDFTPNSAVNNNMYGYGTDDSLRVTYADSYNFDDSTSSDYFGTIYADGTELLVTAAYTAATGTCVVTATSADGGTTYYTATGTGYCGDLKTTNNTSYYDATEESTDSSTSWNNGFGAIDPEFVYDVSAETSSASAVPKTYTIGSTTCYAMTYGSWKGGIALIYVDADTLQPVDSNGNILDHPLDEEDTGEFGQKIAGGYGAAYEGSQLIYNDDTGYYYLFVSMGNLSYEYRVGVGRSTSIEGPYEDAAGNSMSFSSTSTADDYHDYGSKIIGANILDDEYGWRCPGGESILRTADGKIMFACHTRTTFKAGYYFYLQLHQMFFTDDGWPVLNQNEYYDDYDGSDEELSSLTSDDIAGTYDTILTVRGTDTSSYTPYGGTAGTYNTCDETPTTSVSMALSSDGTISGDDYSGTWTLADDGYTITLDLSDAAGASLGTFTGYALQATDWARKGGVTRQTITFTTLDDTSSDTEAGEYFYGNKHNY